MTHLVLCAFCRCMHHPEGICADVNFDDQSDGATCWCEVSFPVAVFQTEEEAIEAIVEDLRP